ncbi:MULTISPECIES: hypothetical protein [unclassified Ochrobactrum]|uniref:hypothetical protein n=1 Tax=unclassified Ochrobactrum TaxID=239106 RepID=UPI0015F95C30|nr:hypothetical protein [Ochrobactrum sp. RH2CCR150]MDH7786314.1 hypothetical protein [Ochrobactrum sp. 19YEA23]
MIVRVAIEYDTEAETAVVQIGNEAQEWHRARLTNSAMTETRDGYLLPISGPRQALILTGVPT